MLFCTRTFLWNLYIILSLIGYFSLYNLFSWLFQPFDTMRVCIPFLKRGFFSLSFFLSFFYRASHQIRFSQVGDFIILYVERCNKMQIKFPDSIFVSRKFYSVKKHTFPHLLLFVYKFKRLLLNFTRKVESSFSVLFLHWFWIDFFFF